MARLCCVRMNLTSRRLDSNGDLDDHVIYTSHAAPVHSIPVRESDKASEGVWTTHLVILLMVLAVTAFRRRPRNTSGTACLTKRSSIKSCKSEIVGPCTQEPACARGTQHKVACNCFEIGFVLPMDKACRGMADRTKHIDHYCEPNETCMLLILFVHLCKALRWAMPTVADHTSIGPFSAPKAIPGSLLQGQVHLRFPNVDCFQAINLSFLGRPTGLASCQSSCMRSWAC